MVEAAINACRKCGNKAILSKGNYDYGWGYSIYIGCKTKCHYQQIALYVPDEWGQESYPNWPKETKFIIKGLISWWNNWATADLRSEESA